MSKLSLNSKKFYNRLKLRNSFMYINKFRYTLLLASLLANIFTEIVCAKTIETKVMCVNNKANWMWLLNDNKEHVTFQGAVKIAKNENKNPRDFESKEWSVKYFLVQEDDPEAKINELQKQCIEKYGEEFPYAQSAHIKENKWLPLGINDSKIAKGIFTVNYEVYVKYWFNRKESLVGLNKNIEYMNVDQLYYEAYFSPDKFSLNPSLLPFDSTS